MLLSSVYIIFLLVSLSVWWVWVYMLWGGGGRGGVACEGYETVVETYVEEDTYFSMRRMILTEGYETVVRVHHTTACMQALVQTYSVCVCVLLHALGEMACCTPMRTHMVNTNILHYLQTYYLYTYIHYIYNT